jgi:hypothetical protein
VRVSRHDEERRAVQGVGARRVDGDGLTVDDEVDVRAGRPADPVLLHEQDALGP